MEKTAPWLFVITLWTQVGLGGEAVRRVPIPSPAQYRWHEQERIMFVHLSPVTWQGVEHDNLSTPLDRITQSVAEPVIRSFQVFHVSNFRLAAGQPLQSPWKQCGSWRAKDFKEGNVILNIKLTPAITETGQWKVCFRSASGNNMTLKEPRMIEDGVPATAGMIARTEGLPSALHLTRSASVTRESNNMLQVLIDSPDIQVKCTTGPRPASHSAIAGVPSSKLVATASIRPVTTLRTPAAWKGPSFPAPLPASLSARVSVSSMPQLVGMPVRDHEAGFLRLLHAVFYRAAIGICIVPFALRPLRLPVLPASLLGFLLPLQFAG